MAKKKDSVKQMAPATTPEGREDQLIALAYNRAEEQLLDGTASSQIITHFLRLGTEKAKLEKEKIRKENLVLEAKAKRYESETLNEALVEEALKAFRGYSGQE